MRRGAHCCERSTPSSTALHTHCWRRLYWWTMPVSEVYTHTHIHTLQIIPSVLVPLVWGLAYVFFFFFFKSYCMILPSMSCQCVCECACTDAQQPVSVYGVCVCVCVCCVCHSTLCNAANPCLGEIRSLIRQPQGLHSVITLNPPPSATTQHHFTLWDLRLDVTRQRESVCACVCVCARVCVCVWSECR